jgi:hypothetical protein
MKLTYGSSSWRFRRKKVDSTHEDDGGTIELGRSSLAMGNMAIKMYTNRETLGQFNDGDDYGPPFSQE